MFLTESIDFLLIFIVRRKMTALKESLKNTEKLLDDALLTLESVTTVCTKKKE